MSARAVKLLTICGPAGVGKSTLGWEIGRQLQAAGVRHAILDSDELDRVWPLSNEARERLCGENLAAFWANASAVGVDHVVLVGVFLDPAADQGWISAAVPGAEVTRVVLDASDAELERRVREREIGSGVGAQLARSLAAARMFRARHATESRVVVTDGVHVADLAGEVIGLAGWRSPAIDTPTRTTPPEALIRPYREVDRPAARRLWVELTEHHRRIYADPDVGGRHPGAELDTYLARIERAGCWVAEAGGQVVGLAGLLDHGGSGEIEPLVVAEGYRGTGIGRALVDRVKAEAAGRGWAYLAVRPVARNTAAIVFFHALGFDTLGGHVDLTADLALRRHPWLSYTHLHGLDFRY